MIIAPEDVGAGAWSAPEATAGRLLRRAAMPPFEQNARIELPDGSYLVADFLWRALRAVVEIDSVEFPVGGSDRDAAMSRHLLLETLGYSVGHRAPAFVKYHSAEFTRGIAAWLAAARPVCAGDPHAVGMPTAMPRAS